jgi:hypothetical protein
MRTYTNKKSRGTKHGFLMRDGRHKIGNKIVGSDEVEQRWDISDCEIEFVKCSMPKPTQSRRERAGKVNLEHLEKIRLLPCAACGARPPSQAAHSNQDRHGKGKSTKANDLATFPLCANCHKRHDEHRGVGWRDVEDQMISSSMVKIYGEAE